MLFAHGSGSSRHSPRNRYVADVLQRCRLGTLLFDLLTPEEDAQTAQTRFDIELLAQRLRRRDRWARDASPSSRRCRSATSAPAPGAAAALMAAAVAATRRRAVVSRGGRPDLAAATRSRA